MRYHNITKDDMLNGDGLRVVLWVSGCNHACPGCHNPVTWDACGGLPFDDAARRELFTELDKSYVSGITFSGGDPLFPANREQVSQLARSIKQRWPHKSIWLYTGYLWEQVRELPVMADLDVLVDGPFVQALKDPQLHWKGSSNQRVIDVRRTLAKGNIVLWS
jgi:anaerobic ribonucleoside-triphosphate reductase activating protein